MAVDRISKTIKNCALGAQRAAAIPNSNRRINITNTLIKKKQQVNPTFLSKSHGGDAKQMLKLLNIHL